MTELSNDERLLNKTQGDENCNSREKAVHFGEVSHPSLVRLVTITVNGRRQIYLAIQ